MQREDGEAVPDFRARVRSLVAELGGGVLAWGADQAVFAPGQLEWIEGAPYVIDIEGGLKNDAGRERLRRSKGTATLGESR
jgi:hypothetical protein